jgi:uncharacterized protein DUF4411
MIYVLDTSSFIVLGHYFPDRFPSFWEHLNGLTDSGGLTAVSEVKKELDNQNTRPHLVSWIKAHPELFPAPTSKEMAYVARIFAVTRFQALISQKARLEGRPAADPFVIARGAVLKGCVVTEESTNPDAVRIPNVCQHFGIRCTNLEGLMAAEGWTY